MAFRRKVMIVTNTLLYGGVERLVVNTARWLLRRGNYYPVVLNLTGKGHFESEIKKHGIEYCSINQENLRRNVIKNLKEVRSIIQDYRPDLIHTHQFASDFYGSLASLGLNIPVISHIHNPCMEFFPRKAIRYLLSRWVISAFIAVVDKKAEEFKKFVPAAKERVYVLYNAIDPESLQLPSGYSRSSYRYQFSIPENALVVGACGRLSWEKGYDLLVKAFRMILQYVPECYLLIVGDGPERSKLEELAAALGVADRVIFAGYRADVSAVMSTFDVFVISSYTESFGLVALEAMWAGLPVVMTNRVSSKDVLSSASLIVSPSAPSLAEGIIYLLTNPEARKRLAAKGKALVETQFTMRTYVEKLEAIYDMVLEGKV
jgi:glycosyltransferase involved in cell wall biosynthesis